MSEMIEGGITVIEGEDTVRTALSLQFVYRGSTICGEYGCFISGAKTLEEIENVMNEYGMPSEYMKDFPSVVMLDANKLGEIKLQRDGSLSQLETLVTLLKEIRKDIRFTRLAVDRFDLLCERYSKKYVESFFNSLRENGIKVILTVDSRRGSNLFELCDSYIIVKKGNCLNFFFPEKLLY